MRNLKFSSSSIFGKYEINMAILIINDNSNPWLDILKPKCCKGNVMCIASLKTVTTTTSVRIIYRASNIALETVRF